MSGSGSRSTSTPPPPPPPPPPLPPGRRLSVSPVDASLTDSPRVHAPFSTPVSTSPPPPPPPPGRRSPALRLGDSSSDSRSGHAPPQPCLRPASLEFLEDDFDAPFSTPGASSSPPPPPPPGRMSPVLRVDSSHSPSDHASTQPPPPPGRRSSVTRVDDSESPRVDAIFSTATSSSSKSREDPLRSDPPPDRSWALLYAFPRSDLLPRGLDFKLENLPPPKVSTITMSRDHAPQGARPLLRLHCVDSTSNLFLMSSTMSMGSAGSRTELLVLQKERGRITNVPMRPSMLTRDAVGITSAITGGRSDGDTDYLIAYLLPSSSASVAAADSAVFGCYDSITCTWSTRHASITSNQFSGLHQVDGVLSLEEKLLCFFHLSSGLILWSAMRGQAFFLTFPGEASSSRDIDKTRRCFGRSDGNLVFVVIHDSPPSISSWTCGMKMDEGEGWVPQNRRVPLLDIWSDPKFISAGIIQAAPSLIMIHPHESNSVLMSCRGYMFCVDLAKRNLIGLPQLITDAGSSVLSSLDFCLWMIPEVPDDILSCWELVKSEEIVDCNPDSNDKCSPYELKLGNTPFKNELLYNKYINYARNIAQNNKNRLDSIEKGAQWVSEFAPLVDQILPVPVCSIAASSSSYIGQLKKAGALVGRALEVLRAAIPPPDHFVILQVANQDQAKDAVSIWNNSLRSEWHAIELDRRMDPYEADAVMKVLTDLDAKRLLWFFHPDLL